jgi:hypothetical protein
LVTQPIGRLLRAANASYCEASVNGRPVAGLRTPCGMRQICASTSEFFRVGAW